MLSYVFQVQVLHIYNMQEWLGRIPPRLQTFSTFFSCLAQPPSAFTSRGDSGKAGWGALEPPVVNGVRTKRFGRDIKVSVETPVLRPRRKIATDQTLSSLKNELFIWSRLQIYPKN